MTATLRSMRWWDIEPVMKLEHELFGSEAWSETMFWSELAERNTRWYVVAEDADTVVGYAGLCAYPPYEAYVQTIAVTTSMQRHGIGTQLLDAVIAESDRRGCEHLDLEVRADNEGAIALYAARGFEQIGVRKRYYQPSGKDAAIMRRVAQP